MDFANERYVRLYTRETTTWKLLPWESQALLPQVLRMVDFSGVLDIGEVEPSAAISAYLPRWPIETIIVGLAGLVDSGVVEVSEKKIVWPKFNDAQAAVSSTAKRVREFREREKITKRDVASRNVTLHHETLRYETKRDETSRNVMKRTLSPSSPLTSSPPPLPLASPSSPPLLHPPATLYLSADHKKLSREAWRDIWNGTVSEIEGPTSTRMYTGSTERLGRNDRKFQLFLETYTEDEGIRGARAILTDPWWGEREIGILTLSRGHNMDDMLAKGGKAPDTPRHGFQVHARKEG